MTVASYPDITGPNGHLAHLRPFVGHSMIGHAGFWPIAGQINGKPELSLYQDHSLTREGGGVIYTVVSYATPIAWVTWSHDVYVLDRRFSVTTAKQQGYCRSWLPVNMAHLYRVRTDFPLLARDL